MCKLIDTHCHLDGILKRLKIDSYAELRRRFFPPEFAACVTISCDPDAIEPTLTLLESEAGVNLASFRERLHTTLLEMQAQQTEEMEKEKERGSEDKTGRVMH